MKVSILTTFADFVGFRKDIQSLAAYSYSLIKDAEIIVMGNDVGTKEICEVYGFRYMDNVKKGKDIGIDTNAILMSDAFEKAKSFVTGDIIIFINGDEILFPNESFMELLNIIYDHSNKNFCGFDSFFSLEWYTNYIKQDRTMAENFEYTKKNYKQIRRTLEYHTGFPLFLWTRNIFNKLQSPDFVIDGWRVDVWLASNMFFLTERVYALSNIMDAVHFDHPRGSSNDGTASTIHNIKMMINSVGAVDEDKGISKIPSEFDFGKVENK